MFRVIRLTEITRNMPDPKKVQRRAAWAIFMYKYITVAERIKCQ